MLYSSQHVFQSSMLKKSELTRRCSCWSIIGHIPPDGFDEIERLKPDSLEESLITVKTTGSTVIEMDHSHRKVPYLEVGKYGRKRSGVGKLRRRTVSQERA